VLEGNLIQKLFTAAELLGTVAMVLGTDGV
jgi:hypothetical protein